MDTQPPTGPPMGQPPGEPPPPARVELGPSQKPGGRGALRGLATGAGLLALFAGKFKLLLLALKFGPAALSMILTVGVYSFAFGLPFAIGLVALLLLHEMGHVIALRLKGLPASLPYFIPFFGAFIAMRQMPRDAAEEAFVGAGGPILGSFAALLAYLIFRITGSPFWVGLAYFGFLINLFNLMPVVPLDGGRILAPTWRWVWVLGLVVAVGLALLLPGNMLLWLIAIVGAWQVWTRLRSQPAPGYYDVPGRDRLTYGLIYLGLLAGLGYMTYLTLHISTGLRQ